ncbi:MAG: hypothetical protein JW932_10025 [Deltaproteobacteria bacterium]|nr:hypothetical protein [Deltaproteobacteria bacterium]
MNPFHHIQSGMADTSLWMLLAIGVGIILLIFILIMIIRRHDIRSNGLTPIENKSLSGEQKEVLAMLRQQGGSMLQTDIADNIGSDHGYMVNILLDLERSGKIIRDWNSEKGAFLVSALG